MAEKVVQRASLSNPLEFQVSCAIHCRARRAAKEAKDAPAQPALLEKTKVDIKKFVKIGRPGYKGLSVDISGADILRPGRGS